MTDKSQSLPFTILGIDHLGIAAKDTNKAQQFFSETLGLSFLGSELVKSQKTLTHMYASSNSAELTHSNSRIELLENQNGEEGPIAAYLQKKGGGIHHIALRVDNLEAAIDYLRIKGVRLIDNHPRLGAHQTKIAFIHPESTGGILLELTAAQ